MPEQYQGIAADPSGAAVSGANVRLRNPVTGYDQTATCGADGQFRLINIPPNQYQLTVDAPRFAAFGQDISVRGSLPIQIKASLSLSGTEITVNVEASGADLVELDTSAHVDSDRRQFTNIPAFGPGGGLSQAITYSTGGVAADANVFFTCLATMPMFPLWWMASRSLINKAKYFPRSCLPAPFKAWN